MVHAGTIGDWLLLTVLLGGLAAASWFVYTWGVAQPEPSPVEVRPEDLRRAA
jgi:hypothetical protein